MWRPSLACTKIPVGSAGGAAITATLQANPSAVPGCPRHTGLLCSLCSLPTQPSSLHQHIHQSLLAEAFVLCLHRKVWARGSHSCCQHGMIFIDKSIIDPAPSRRTFTCCAFAGDVWIQTQTGSQSNPSGMCPAPVNIKHLWRYLCISPGWEEPAAFFS